jgi:hypothetical protein
MGVVHEEPKWRPTETRLQQMNLGSGTIQQLVARMNVTDTFIISCPCKYKYVVQLYDVDLYSTIFM